MPKPNSEEGVYGDSVVEVFRDGDLWYNLPKTLQQVTEARRLGIPQKTQDRNTLVANVWCGWVQHRLQMPWVEKEEKQIDDFVK